MAARLQWMVPLFFLACCQQPRPVASQKPQCGDRRVRVAQASDGALNPGSADHKPCLGLFVSESDQDGCSRNGMTLTKPIRGDSPGEVPADGEDWKLLEVRAVYYVPRPVGASATTDVYLPEFHYLHKRDLRLIKENTQANAIRIAPWNIKKDHEAFMSLCREYGLWVIPTFDFKQYAQPRFIATMDDLVTKVAQDFQKFLQGVDTQQVLAWSINYGLHLGDNVRLGPSSTNEPGKDLQSYFELLCLVRLAHYKEEWNQTEGAFRRPLALPLDLTTRRKIGGLSDVGWYMGFTETNWGSFPDCAYSYIPDIEPEAVGKLRPLGAFDMWILEGMAPASTMGADDLLEVVDMVNNTVEPSSHAWPDLFTRQSADKSKDKNQDCTGKSKGGCTYRTRKAVLAQVGFSALKPSFNQTAFNSKVVTPAGQLEAMKRSWVGPKGLQLNDAKSRTTCTSGVLIDEWMDDWDRIATLGSNCDSDPLSHVSVDTNSLCGKPLEALRGGIYPEWLGMNSQSSFLSFHCIDPRTSNGKWFCFDGKNGECDHSLSIFNRCASMAVDAGNFAGWATLGTIYILFPSYSSSIPVGFAMLAISLVISGVTCIRCCSLIKRSAAPISSSTEHTSNSDRDDDHRTQSSAASSAQDLPSLASENDENSVKMGSKRVEFMLPKEYLLTGGQEVDRFGITLLWEKTKGGKGGKSRPRSERFTQRKAELFLQAHASAQMRRLQAQVEAEMNEIRCIRGDIAKEREIADLPEAMGNVHARALEGYLVWLSECAGGGNSAMRVMQLTSFDDETKTVRKPSELYVEVLVLRILESLSEQILHAPEYIAMFYHHVLWPGHDDAIDYRNFTINYEELHQGLEKIMENPNIYNNGVNFDDINDCGRHRLPSPLRKTFHEAPSMLVLIDLLSNFSPVFTIKLWIFLIAFYVHEYFISTTRDETELSIYVGIRLDAGVVFVVETLTLLLGFWQRRCSWPVNRRQWILRRLSLLCIGFTGILLCAVRDFHGLLDEFGIWPAAAWCILRVVVFFFLHQSVPSLCGHSPAPPYLPGRPRDIPSPEKDAMTKSRHFWWIAMLACCLVFEMFLLVPLAAQFYFNKFCSLSCELDMGLTTNMFSTTCVSCTSALILLWTMVGLTAFFDIFYMFYLGSAMVGYWMGHRRKLGNVLKTAQRQIKLNSTETRRIALHIGGEVERTDALLMRKVFGRAWRMIWSRMVESLYQESLISSEAADKLVTAASTIRWRDRENTDRSKMVFQGEKFTKLKFCPWEHRAPPPQLENGNSSASSAVNYSTATMLPWNCGACIAELEIQIRGGDRSINSHCFKTSELPEAVTPYDELEFDIPSHLEAVEVHAMWFKTQTDQDSKHVDPTKWELWGLSKGTDTWKQLIVQDSVYMPSEARGRKEGPFIAETWQQQIERRAPRSPRTNSINLSELKLPEEAGEKLCFFLASLRLIATDATNVSRPVDSSLLKHDSGHLPSLTQIIPCFDETVLNSERFLREKDGVNTNLGFIISQYPDEWRFFAQGLGRDPKELYIQFDEGVAIDCKTIMEIRMWAANRSQTVARTIVGAMQYHSALDLYPEVEGCPHKDFRDAANLILAHQTFGMQGSAERQANDAAVLYLMWQYKQHPFLLVFDFDRDRMREPVKSLVEDHLKSKYKLSFTASSSDLPRHASVLACYSGAELTHSHFPDSSPPYKEGLQILEVIPREYKLLIGKDKFFTQGKAGNQLGALRFATGHYVQMMDANMGAFFGEACKVPFVLRQFQPTSRRYVACRILGFREVIFTAKHGATGSIMASGEWSFGTICQRFLDGLDVRMHYGHPDFIDAFWASNRGSLSKASPSINLSEDIFAGFNVRMRGERSVHRDTLAWDKGREASFNAASQFFYKVSSGNVGVMRSRDLKVITERLGIIDNLSFYFASVAFYLNNWLIDMSLRIYVLVFVLMTLSSKTLDDIGSLGSMLAAEWILTMGIIAMLPRLMELILEYGYSEGLLKFIPSIPGVLLGYTFMNKSIAAGVQDTLLTGQATYIKTGRPNANKRYTWRECYFVHCQSHYYPAFSIFFWYIFYRALAMQRDTAALPMFMILATLLVWLVAPILFCPQPRLQSVQDNLKEFFSFIIAKPEETIRERDPGVQADLRATLEDTQATLYEKWLFEALSHKDGSKTIQFVVMLWHILVFLFLVSITHSLVYGLLWNFFLLFIGHSVLMFLWRSYSRPEALLFLALALMLGVPTIIFPLVLDDMNLGNGLFSFLLLVQGLEMLKHIVLLVARCYFGWYGFKWADMPANTDDERRRREEAARKEKNYDILVEYLYVNFLSYEIHLCRAFIILLLNLGVQSVLVFADVVFGLHSACVLNSNLGCTCGGRTQPYEPESGPTRSSRASGAPSAHVAAQAAQPIEAEMRCAGAAGSLYQVSASSNTAATPLIQES